MNFNHMLVLKFITIKLEMLGLDSTLKRILAFFIFMLFLAFSPLLLSNLLNQMIYRLVDSSFRIQFISGLEISIFLLAIIFSYFAISSFTHSKEKTFLDSFPVNHANYMLILFMESTRFLLILSLLFYAFEWAKGNSRYYPLITLVGIIFFNICCFCLQMIIRLLANRVRILELRLFILLLPVAIMIVLNIFKSLSASTLSNKNFIIRFFIEVGTSEFSRWLFIPNAEGLLVLLSVIGSLILFLVTKGMKKQVPNAFFSEHVRVLKGKKIAILNRKSIFSCSPNSYVCNIIKDISLMGKNIWFLPIQLPIILFAALIIIQSDSLDNVVYSVIWGVVGFLSSSFCQEIFQIDENKLWIYKSMPIKEIDYFIYKVLAIYVLSLFPLIALDLLCVFLGKLSIANIIVDAVLQIVYSFIISATWSSIIFGFITNLKRSTIAFLLLVPVLLIIPVTFIPVIYMGIKTGLRKWNKMEV